MAFKLNNPPYSFDSTPIYHVDMEDGVLGKANNNGSIIINKDVDPEEKRKCYSTRKSTHRSDEAW